MSQILASFPPYHESTPMSEQEKHAHLPETPLPRDNPGTDGPTEATTWEAYSPEILEAVLDP
jgi:hypothetical protein